MTNTDGKIKVRADIRENILYMTYTGVIRKKHIENAYTDVRFCIADLKPGFALITDISHARLAHLSGVATFQKAMSYILDNGVSHIIRIIEKDNIIVKQISRISEPVEGYKPIYVSSLAEAMEKLAEQQKQQKSNRDQ